MNAKRSAKAREEYDKIEAYAIREYRANPKTYIADFLTRKAKAESGSLAYGVIAAIVVNMSWQFVSSFLTTTVPSSAPDDLLYVLKLFSLGMDFVFLASSVAIVYSFYVLNRKQRRQLSLEEHILRKHGYLY